MFRSGNVLHLVQKSGQQMIKNTFKGVWEKVALFQMRRAAFHVACMPWAICIIITLALVIYSAEMTS